MIQGVGLSARDGHGLRALALFVALALLGLVPLAQAAQPDPAADRMAFQRYFQRRFPSLPLAAYVDGPYNFSASARAQWEQIVEFPPYSFAIADGKTLFETIFPNGRSYASCFSHGGIGIAQNYPVFDPKTGQVVTLGIAVNRCRTANGLARLNLTKGPIADILSYMTDTSRGRIIDVRVPDDKRALAAYEAGKKYFYTRRGQLNFSCASCHVQAAGRHLRGDVLAPALGLTASFPLYRSEWGEMGTLVRRFVGCNRKIRAEPEKADSAAYRDLAYFLAAMETGLPAAGPGARP